jgi:hypothetical protein
MPVISQFMGDDTIKFECITANNLKAPVSFKMSDGHNVGKIFYADARLRKSAKKEEADK